MRQYTPCGRAAEFPEIDRRITDEEYEACESYMEELGIIDGYVQQKESAEAASFLLLTGRAFCDHKHVKSRSCVGGICFLLGGLRVAAPFDYVLKASIE